MDISSPSQANCIEMQIYLFYQLFTLEITNIIEWLIPVIVRGIDQWRHASVIGARRNFRRNSRGVAESVELRGRNPVDTDYADALRSGDHRERSANLWMSDK
jgi:hypothetical protein